MHVPVFASLPSKMRAPGEPAANGMAGAGMMTLLHLYLSTLQPCSCHIMLRNLSASAAKILAAAFPIGGDGLSALLMYARTPIAAASPLYTARSRLFWLSASAPLLPAGLAGRSREVLAERPSEAMAVASGAGLVVAMRLHGLILAALAGAPCAALSYDPKVQAAAEGLGCPCHSLDAMAAPAELLAAWSGALDSPPAAARLAALRQQTEVHRQLLQDLANQIAVR
jgi:hypothetical protein